MVIIEISEQLCTDYNKCLALFDKDAIAITEHAWVHGAFTGTSSAYTGNKLLSSYNTAINGLLSQIQ